MLRSCVRLRKGHNATVALASVQLTSLRFWRRQEEERQASSWASQHLKGILRPTEGGQAPYLPINALSREFPAQRWPTGCGHHGRGREYCTGSQLADQLEKIQGVAEAPKRAAVDEYEVVEFLPDASYKALRLNLRSARLDPRDISLFAERRGFSNQRATLMPRDGLILFRTEITRSIVMADRAWIFQSRREKETLRLVQAVRTGILAGEAEIPFELRVLEALLSETVRQFERHHKRLLLLSDSVEREINHVLKTSSGDLTRLLPIQKRLTELRQDVVETRDTIKQVLETDQLAGLCLTELAGAGAAGDAAGASPRELPSSSESVREAALLLQSYERQISTVEGALKEKQDYLEVVREVWGMQLDATRNRIIRIDLVVAIASFALIMPTVPAAFFGMNLKSGMEESSIMFWPVVYTSLCAASLAFAAVYAYWRFYPNSRSQRRINDVKALHDLLSHHIDDLEDVMAALKDVCDHPYALSGEHGKLKLGKKEFSKLVRQTIKHRNVNDEEVDLLYRVFDSNRDGFLSMAEIMWNETKVLSGDGLQHMSRDNCSVSR